MEASSPTSKRDIGRWTAWVLLLLILGGALALRLWSINHGLPFSYNADENEHFTSIAVRMFGTSLNPGYFENPPGLTYLFFLLFKLRFGAGFPFNGKELAQQFAVTPGEFFEIARTTVAILGVIGIGLVYVAGARIFDRRVGLIASATIAVAFLPVFYSKFALNDVVTMLPVTLALLGSYLIYTRGRKRDWLLAGIGVGLAAATKYTAGATALIPLAAALLRPLPEPKRPGGKPNFRPLLIGALITVVAAAVVYLLLNPYSLIEFSEFRREVADQSATAGGSNKLGQEDIPGWIYYIKTLTWGFGWIPALAAFVGAILLIGTDRRKAIILLVFPVFMFLFLGAQARYFGRWLMPTYPVLALLAGYALVRAADALPWKRPATLAALLGLVALTLAQGVYSSVRIDRVLGRTDTRTLALQWLTNNTPQGARVVIEPAVPDNFLAVNPFVPKGQRLNRFHRLPVQRPYQTYTRKLSPALVDVYRGAGYCWVMVSSHQKDRGLAAGLEGARDYYSRLAGESERPVIFSPYGKGEAPVKFSFDLSFNYYPSAFYRPGPTVEIYRLKDCVPKTGRG